MRRALEGSLLPWLHERWLEIVMLLGLAGILAWFAGIGYSFLPKPKLVPTPIVRQFDGQAAYQYVSDQVAFGPRPSGSRANIQTGDYIITQLKQAGWQVGIQKFTYMDVVVRNIIGKAGAGPVVIVGAHYDTRLRADHDLDPELRSEPVLGANDGASGVAVLLELAHSLDKTRLSHELWLTFFDAEDNGQLDSWEFNIGSRYMAEHLTVLPESVIIVDMVGDAEQQIYRERTSTPKLQDQIWAIAARLGYGDYFIPEYKWSLLDSHTPFQQRDIPTLDLIDFDYLYWHTTHDTIDKIAPASLGRVGRVLQVFLEER